MLLSFSMVGNGAVALLNVIKKMAMLRLYAAMILGCTLATFGFALLDYLGGGKNQVGSFSSNLVVLITVIGVERN